MSGLDPQPRLVWTRSSPEVHQTQPGQLSLHHEGSALTWTTVQMFVLRFSDRPITIVSDSQHQSDRLRGECDVNDANVGIS